MPRFKPKSASKDPYHKTSPVRQPVSTKPLAPRKLAFARIYSRRLLAGDTKGLGGGSAIEAGYAPRSASQKAHELLGDPRVRAIIEAEKVRLAERFELTQDKIQDELVKVGFANMGDYMRPGPDGDPYLDFSQLTPRQTAALKEVVVEDFKDGRTKDARQVRRIKFRMHDKVGALNLLGKSQGMFPDRHLVTPLPLPAPTGPLIEGQATEVQMSPAEAYRRLIHG